LLYQVATIAALMAIGKHRATGPHPKGWNAVEGGAGTSFLPREEAARRRQPSTAGKKVGIALLRDQGRLRSSERGVRYASKKGCNGRTSGQLCEGETLAYGIETPATTTRRLIETRPAHRA
jgi:hypothetical protein